jgi:hypothetical protein
MFATQRFANPILVIYLLRNYLIPVVYNDGNA